MTFIWPEMLWLLVAAPVLIALYAFLLYRKRKATARFAGLLMMQKRDERELSRPTLRSTGAPLARARGVDHFRLAPGGRGDTANAA